MKLAGLGIELVYEVSQEASAQQVVRRHQRVRQHRAVHIFHRELPDAHRLEHHVPRFHDLPIRELQMHDFVLGPWNHIQRLGQVGRQRDDAGARIQHQRAGKLPVEVHIDVRHVALHRHLNDVGFDRVALFANQSSIERVIFRRTELHLRARRLVDLGERAFHVFVRRQLLILLADFIELRRKLHHRRHVCIARVSRLREVRLPRFPELVALLDLARRRVDLPDDLIVLERILHAAQFFIEVAIIQLPLSDRPFGHADLRFDLGALAVVIFQLLFDRPEILQAFGKLGVGFEKVGCAVFNEPLALERLFRRRFVVGDRDLAQQCND